jgi:hypothetical protein
MPTVMIILVYIHLGRVAIHGLIPALPRTVSKLRANLLQAPRPALPTPPYLRRREARPDFAAGAAGVAM